MIISASRRTDIPAIYGEWFVNRLKAGYALVKNQFNPMRMTKVILLPETVDGIVFWTKNPIPFMDKLKEIEALGFKNYYFQFTLTPYDAKYESNLPLKSVLEDAFIELSKRIGGDRVIFRYDPIIINSNLNKEYHYRHFERLLTKFADHTRTVVISFMDDYDRMHYNSTAINLKALDVMDARDAELMHEMAAKFVAIKDEIAPKIKLCSCAEPVLNSVSGIHKSKCIDDELIEKIGGFKLDPAFLKEASHQRVGCGCIPAVDIGAVNTCLNRCIYCYATSFNKSDQNHAVFDAKGEMLCGSASGQETVTLKNESWKLKTSQTSLFDLM